VRVKAQVGAKSDLRVKSIGDLEKLLKDVGYSRDATSEILKWYRETSSDRAS
jgi:hypothetical protein